MKKFEEDLIIKTAKIIKKKKMKMKKDGEKADKALVTEKARILKDMEDKEMKRKIDEAEKEISMKKKIESERLECLRNMMAMRKKRLSTVKSMQCSIDVYASALDATQKKLKNLRKKLRDIQELEVKISSGLKASKEQKEKIEKKQGVEDDIIEMEEAEEELKNNIPSPVPASLLVEDEGWDAVTESFVLSASNTSSTSPTPTATATAHVIDVSAVAAKATTATAPASTAISSQGQGQGQAGRATAPNPSTASKDHGSIIAAKKKKK